MAALTGEPVTAHDAERYGLVAILAEPGHALAIARDVATRIAANGPLAVKATKKILAHQSNWTHLPAFEWQREITSRVRESADANEGALAFAEKRAAQWQAGRPPRNILRRE